MENNSFSFSRFGMLLRAEFIIHRKLWLTVFGMYFLIVTFLVLGKYFLRENYEEIIKLFSSLMHFSFFLIIFLSQRGLVFYTDVNIVIANLIVPASKSEKYFTTLFFSFGLPIFILTSLPLIFNYLFSIHNFLFNNLAWYSMLIALMFVLNFMKKSYFRFILSCIAVIVFVAIYRKMENVYFVITSQMLIVIFIMVTVIALFYSWHLFKNYSIDKI